MHKIIRVLFGLVIVISFCGFTGCDSGTKRSHKNMPSRDDFENVAAETTPHDTLPPLPPRKMEVFDSTFKNGPRIQFVWAGYDDTISTIWSIKTDGTDLREVADTSMLYTDSCNHYIEQRPWRSQDGRWLSYFLSTDIGLDVKYSFLIDLKTGERRNLGKLSTTGQFTSDSKYLFYWSEGDLIKYNLLKKKKEQVPYKPFSHSSELFFSKEKPHFFTLRTISIGSFLRKYDFSYTVLQDAPILTERPSPFMFFISPNGQYMCYSRHSKLYWTTVTSPADTGNSIAIESFIDPMINNTGKSIYYSTGQEIACLNTDAASTTMLFKGNKQTISNLTLYQ